MGGGKAGRFRSGQWVHSAAHTCSIANAGCGCEFRGFEAGKVQGTRFWEAQPCRTRSHAPSASWRHSLNRGKRSYFEREQPQLSSPLSPTLTSPSNPLEASSIAALAPPPPITHIPLEPPRGLQHRSDHGPCILVHLFFHQSHDCFVPVRMHTTPGSQQTPTSLPHPGHASCRVAVVIVSLWNNPHRWMTWIAGRMCQQPTVTDQDEMR